MEGFEEVVDHEVVWVEVSLQQAGFVGVHELILML